MPIQRRTSGDPRSHSETRQRGVYPTLVVITRGGAKFCDHKAAAWPLPVLVSWETPLSVDSWSMTFRKTYACCLRIDVIMTRRVAILYQKMNKNHGPKLEGIGQNDFFRRKQKLQTYVVLQNAIKLMDFVLWNRCCYCLPNKECNKQQTSYVDLFQESKITRVLFVVLQGVIDSEEWRNCHFYMVDLHLTSTQFHALNFFVTVFFNLLHSIATCVKVARILLDEVS